MGKPFIWKKKNSKNNGIDEIEILTLEELLQSLISIRQEEIDQEITKNCIRGNLLPWLKQNFPKQIQLTTHLQNMITEFTPQQIREMLVRELQRITSVS